MNAVWSASEEGMKTRGTKIPNVDRLRKMVSMGLSKAMADQWY